MIIADIHEPESLKSLADKVEELQIDYIVVGSERKYAVERKEVMDLWASVKDGRLWRQLSYMEKMREEGYIPILLIEGSLGKLFKFTKVSPKQFMGIQLAFSSFGVSVVQLSPKLIKMFLSFLNDKAGKKRKYERVIIPKPIERTLDEEREDVLAAIRGIGVKTASKMLKEFGSLYNVFLASDDDLKRILGGKAGHFVEVLRGGYGER